LNSKLNDIRKNKAFGNMLKLSFGNIIMYVLPFLVTPILSRLYEKEHFGEWGVFSSFISIVTVLIFLGYENAIVKIDRREEKDIVALCLLLGCSTSLLIGGTFVLGKSLGVSFFNSFPSFTLLMIYLFFFILHTVCYNVSNRHEQYTILSVNHIIQGGSQGLFRIVFGAVGLTVANGLLLGTVLAQAITALFLVAFVLMKIKMPGARPISFSSMSRCALENKSFPLYDAPASALSFAAFNLPLLILSAFFSQSIIGCYSIILQLLLLPMSFVGSAVGKVYYQEICDTEDEGKIKQVTKKVVNATLLLSAIPTLFICLGGDKLIVWFLGDKWHEAGSMSICLSLWAMSTILTQPLIPLFRRINKQHILLRYELLYFIVGIGCILFACNYRYGFATILISYSVGCATIKALMFRKVLGLVHLSLSDFIRSLPLCILALLFFIFRTWEL